MGLELQREKALSRGTIFLGFLDVHAGEMFPDTVIPPTQGFLSC